MKHLTDSEIQEYLDRSIDPARSGGVEDHVRACSECSAKVAAFQRLGREIWRIPLERVSNNFTSRVMRAVGLGTTAGLVKQLVVNLLPIVGLAIVVALLVGFLAAPEQPQQTLGGEAGRYVESFQQTVSRALSSGSLLIADWTRQLAAVFASMPSVKFVLWILVAFAAIAIFDEFVFVPMMKKKG